MPVRLPAPRLDRDRQVALHASRGLFAFRDVGLLAGGWALGNFSISWGICRAIRHNKAYIKSGSMGMSFFAPCP
ncbi:MAG: hypothetical protein J7K02_01570 [Deltaproteobacteria bacterium]|nr:hypothetical protein [Deltaproteobacteria bacterium]